MTVDDSRTTGSPGEQPGPTDGRPTPPAAAAAPVAPGEVQQQGEVVHGLQPSEAKEDESEKQETGAPEEQQEGEVPSNEEEKAEVSETGQERSTSGATVPPAPTMFSATEAERYQQWFPDESRPLREILSLNRTDREAIEIMRMKMRVKVEQHERLVKLGTRTISVFEAEKYMAWFKDGPRTFLEIIALTDKKIIEKMRAELRMKIDRLHVTFGYHNQIVFDDLEEEDWRELKKNQEVSQLRYTGTEDALECIIRATQYHGGDTFFGEAIMAYKETIIATRRDLEHATVLLKVPVHEETKVVLGYACRNLGIIRLSSERFRNEHEAYLSFKQGALECNDAESIFYYSYCLVHGLGGARRKVPLGIGLLNYAGARGVGHAYFILGSIFEQGITDLLHGGVAVDVSKAKHYYVSAQKQYTESTNVISPLLQFNQKSIGKAASDSVSSWLHTEGWHVVEGMLSNVVGDRFSWTLAGQAFLFGAAASLSATDEPEHYPTLLVLLPILGMILATFSFVHVGEAILRNDRRRESIREMLVAKMGAYEKFLDYESAYTRKIEEAKKNAGQGEIDKLIGALDTGREEQCVKCQREEQDPERKKFKRHKWIVWWLRRSATWIEGLVVLLSVVFFVSWLLLLINEVKVHDTEGCSDWWTSACSANVQEEL